MKIVAGLGSIDDYEAFCKAGADEVFIGYVPGDYYIEHLKDEPINRREVMFYNVQVGSESELLILKSMEKEYGVPVTVTLNSLSYVNYNEIEAYVFKLMKLGFCSFIVADEGLVTRLSKIPDIKIHISGEFGEMNHLVLDSLHANPARVIFPRQTSLAEMTSVIKHVRNHGHEAKEMEFEAFVLNEKCHFTGAYCNSYHCDELCHMCHLPYRLMKGSTPVLDSRSKDEDIYAGSSGDELGAGGCGICSLAKLKEAGVTHLKIVSRGNDGELTVRDIRSLKRALDILEESFSEEEFVAKVMAEQFPAGCSHNCYYQ